MKILIFFISVLTFITSCDNKKKEDVSATSHKNFDKVQWQAKEGEAYPYRDELLQNLIDSVNLKNIPYDSIINILGQPDRVNEGHLYYNISRKEMGAVTLGTKSFVIKLKADSTVEWRKVHGG